MFNLHWLEKAVFAINYYSHFFKIAPLDETTAKQVSAHSKSIFVETVMSDKEL